MATKTKLQKPLMAVAPLVLALAFGGPALRAEALESQGSTSTVSDAKAKACAAKKSDTQLTRADGHVSRTLTTSATRAVESGEIRVHAPKSALVREDAKVYRVKSGGKTVASVTIPVRGVYSIVSNLTVLYDARGEIVQYGETLISENQSGNFNITSYADGSLVKSNDTTMPYMSNADLQRSEIASPKNGVVQSEQGAAGCIAAVLGVSGFVAYLIVGACTGACAVPGVGTAVCVACIGAYAAVGGASITAIASCFK